MIFIIGFFEHPLNMNNRKLHFFVDLNRWLQFSHSNKGFMTKKRVEQKSNIDRFTILLVNFFVIQINVAEYRYTLQKNNK